MKVRSKMTKSALTILSILMFSLLVACDAQYSGDYPHYDTAEDMMHKADLVITAVVDKHEVRAGEEYRYDVYAVSLNNVYKGVVEASQGLEVRYMLNEVSTLTAGKEYLFFLETYDSVPPMALNVTQATYEVVGQNLANVVNSVEGFEEVLEFSNGDILADSSAEVAYNPIFE